MKQSLWILTSSLLALFFGTIIFALFTGVKKYNLHSIKAAIIKEASTKKISPREITAIYENDLFSTYTPSPVIQKIEKTKIESPRVPDLVSSPQIPKQEPSFLEPIPFTLVGTIVAEVDSESRAVVSDNRTKKEQSYALGNEVEDAQIIDINYKSITLIRSNGQKETLYLPGFDKILAKFNAVDSMIAKNIGEFEYIIDPDAFINRVRTLGKLIAELNITTAYENGISIGCKIGVLTDDSIAKIMGLEKGDIISKINNMPTATLQDRIDVYNLLTSLNKQDHVNISLKRSDKNIELKYLIQTIDNPISENLNNPKINDNIESKVIKQDLERRYKFAPTIAEIKEKERELIIKQLHQKNK